MSQLIAVNASAAVLRHASPGRAAPPAFSQIVRNEPETTAFAGFECAGALALMFGPAPVASPSHRATEVCLSDAPLADVVPRGWRVDAVPATDVFAAADPHVKRRLAVLYGGQRPLVARGWIARGHVLESVTLVSPRPDPSLTRLVPGTLLIRIVTDR